MGPGQRNPRRFLIFTPNASEEFEERDLVTTVFPESDTTAEARVGYGTEAESFAVVLVGRDGTEKFRSGTPVTARALFGKIDARPMRHREMSAG